MSLLSECNALSEVAEVLNIPRPGKLYRSLSQCERTYGHGNCSRDTGGGGVLATGEQFWSLKKGELKQRCDRKKGCVNFDVAYVIIGMDTVEAKRTTHSTLTCNQPPSHARQRLTHLARYPYTQMCHGQLDCHTRRPMRQFLFNGQIWLLLAFWASIEGTTSVSLGTACLQDLLATLT